MTTDKFTEGYDAFVTWLENKGEVWPTPNPYKEGTEDYQEWNNGFLVASIEHD